jgi:DtxR family Mn-dependent transcriptional regulator
LRISDRDPAVLRELAADLIGPGTEFTLAAALTIVLADGQNRLLTTAAAASIWVTA